MVFESGSKFFAFNEQVEGLFEYVKISLLLSAPLEILGQICRSIFAWQSNLWSTLCNPSVGERGKGLLFSPCIINESNRFQDSIDLQVCDLNE